MIELNTIILNSLSDIGIPVFFQEADEGTKLPYITFFRYNELGVRYADDKEEFRQHSIQVDIWSKGSYAQYARKVEKLLKAAGFNFLNGADLYEKDIQVYHKGMRFSYVEERNDVNE